ncbi:histidine phosphatase family protein [Phycicoccus flavus]|uniref:Histidine phosphatase family protein n=1 Tax=Phycicoccus flavus TaxID=2502783 RepID=A0A8T6R6C8_9MICO|nr:histidine phosphatase family protein [Phycicoccus flavus]NHA70008.1 histidine phosphatase family protein [Phycicoccus flavus]
MSEPGRLVLVRHGQTEWSASGRHTGRTDLPLTAQGEQDARALHEPLAGFDVGLVLSSPLKRARRTAELAGLAVDRVDADLLEWDYGGYEGLTTPQVREQRGDEWTVFDDGVVPGDTPGETVEEVAARASRVLQRVGPDLADRDVVLVGHGHALRVLTATYLRQEPRFGAHVVLDAGALCVLGREHGKPALLAWNARR